MNLVKFTVESHSCCNGITSQVGMVWWLSEDGATVSASWGVGGRSTVNDKEQLLLDDLVFGRTYLIPVEK